MDHETEPTVKPSDPAQLLEDAQKTAEMARIELLKAGTILSQIDHNAGTIRTPESQEAIQAVATLIGHIGTRITTEYEEGCREKPADETSNPIQEIEEISEKSDYEIIAKDIPFKKPQDPSRAFRVDIVGDNEIYVFGQKIELKGSLLFLFNTLIRDPDGYLEITDFLESGYVYTQKGELHNPTNACNDALNRLLNRVNTKEDRPIIHLIRRSNRNAYALNPNVNLEDMRGIPRSFPEIPQKPIGEANTRDIPDYKKITDDIPQRIPEDQGSVIFVDVVDDNSIQIDGNTVRLSGNKLFIFNSLIKCLNPKGLEAKQILKAGFSPPGEQPSDKRAIKSILKSLASLKSIVNIDENQRIIEHKRQKNKITNALCPNVVVRDLRPKD